MRRGAKPTKPKVDSKRSAASKSQKREGSRVRELEKRLAEALQREAEALKRQAEAQEQQAATAKILQVISQSPMGRRPCVPMPIGSSANAVKAAANAASL